MILHPADAWLIDELLLPMPATHATSPHNSQPAEPTPRVLPSTLDTTPSLARSATTSRNSAL